MAHKSEPGGGLAGTLEMDQSGWVTENETPVGDGLSSLAQSDSPNEVIARYDSWTGTYDDDLASWGYEVPDNLANRMAEALDASNPGGPILDAGCGTGLVGRRLAALGLGPLVGIDASAQSLARAESAGIYDSVATANLLKTLEFETNTFAGTVCGGVLTYLADTQQVLSELVRVTKPGGTVIATQRTDLWVERNCDQVMISLGAQPGLTVDRSEPQPYLPGHPEYGEDILVIYITLSVT